MEFYVGQKVDYRRIWAGCEFGYGEPLKDWFTGYVVVSPISPFNSSMVLIQKIEPGPIDTPFNVLPENLRDTDQTNWDRAYHATTGD